MKAGTKLKAKLPAYADNGLGQLRDQLLDDPDAQHIAIVVLNCAREIRDHGDGETIRTPVIQILRIEPEPDPDEAARLLAWAARLARKRNPPPAARPAPDPIPGVDLQHGTGLHVVGDR